MKIATIIAMLLAFAAYADEPVVIAAFGDSLSAGYSLPTSQGFAPVLEKRLRAKNLPVKVVNAAVSGNTTSDALSRVNWMLANDKPDIVMVQFGANDMFRGVPIKFMRGNFDKIIQRIQNGGATVLLAGIVSPDNYGKKYRDELRDMYQDLSARHQVPLYPFFLQGVALKPSLNLPDGQHPNAEGVRVIVANVAPLIAEMVQRRLSESAKHKAKRFY